jgi:hypothetical protein
VEGCRTRRLHSPVPSARAQLANEHAAYRVHAATRWEIECRSRLSPFFNFPGRCAVPGTWEGAPSSPRPLGAPIYGQLLLACPPAALSFVRASLASSSPVRSTVPQLPAPASKGRCHRSCISVQLARALSDGHKLALYILYIICHPPVPSILHHPAPPSRLLRWTGWCLARHHPPPPAIAQVVRSTPRESSGLLHQSDLIAFWASGPKKRTWGLRLHEGKRIALAASSTLFSVVPTHPQKHAPCLTSHGFTRCTCNNFRDCVHLDIVVQGPEPTELGVETTNICSIASSPATACCHLYITLMRRTCFPATAASPFICPAK